VVGALVPVRGTALLLALTGLVGASAALAAHSDAEFQSKVVDRTFLCTPRLFLGSRDLDLRVSYPYTVSKSPFSGITVTPAHYPGHVSVNSGPEAPTSQLVYVVSRPSRRTASYLERPGVYVNVRRCSPARASVPLTSQGFQGPPARWSTDTTCELQERVGVRLRARLQSAASWGRAGTGLVGVRRNVVKAAVAIRGEKSRRPIAYFEMDKAGKTSLWSSSSCR
jgi:hypothetical protein